MANSDWRMVKRQQNGDLLERLSAATEKTATTENGSSHDGKPKRMG